MPTPDKILSGLQEITNTWQTISILWHIYFGVLTVVLVIGFRPSRRFAGLLLGLPFLSVSACAWLLTHPVNSVIFAIINTLLLIVVARLPCNIIRIAPGWSRGSGALLFVFGWIYISNS